MGFEPTCSEELCISSATVYGQLTDPVILKGQKPLYREGEVQDLHLFLRLESESLYASNYTNITI